MNAFCGIVSKFAPKLRKNNKNRMNKEYICSLCFVLLTALSLTSCLNGDDDDEGTYYDDMAITTFTLSTVKQTVHVTSSQGTDSTYMTTLTSNLPVFTIDQYKHLIYNRDSLASGCDLSHVLATIYGKNSSVIGIKSLTSDSVMGYSSTDSIDFSQPREIRVYATDGSGYRAYTVTVNMRKTVAGKMTWQEAEAESAPAALFQTVAMKPYDEAQAVFWLSDDNGESWSTETIGAGENASLLPVTDLAWVSFPYSASSNTDYEMLIGSRDDGTDKSMIWRKIVNKRAGSASASWVNLPLEPANIYYLPKLSSPSLVWFEGCVLAISSDRKFYESRDQGITWKTSKISLPEDLSDSPVKAAGDADGYFWLMSTESGKVWKGYMTK